MAHFASLGVSRCFGDACTSSRFRKHNFRELWKSAIRLLPLTSEEFCLHVWSFTAFAMPQQLAFLFIYL